mmetsp:Transcript_29981/g.54621  ORF Transcript_29981/g.54621 Transcript_29981/m.54621 type:complete len:318 (+) Transcript_29981:159-1112(+)
MQMSDDAVESSQEPATENKQEPGIVEEEAEQAATPERREEIRNGVASGHWWLLQDAPAELKADKEIVMNAVRCNGRSLEHCADCMQSDREVVLAAVAQDGIALKFVHESLRGDREVVLQAVSHSGGALHWASDEMKADREVVMRAVRKEGGALECASEELRGQADIVETAIKTKREMLQFATPELLMNGDFLLNCLNSMDCWDKIDSNYLQHCSQDTLEIIAEKVKPKYVLKVSMLSGKSCIIVSHGGNSSKSIRWTSARFLGLGAQQYPAGRLILPGGMAPEESPIDKWEGVEAGLVNEVQLVLRYGDDPQHMQGI